MNKQPLISIIIPVYNTEKYLARCLDSVISQTVKDIEIIAVNDDSTDSSLSVLEEYTAKDPRIHVISVKNGGVSRARNIALEKAKGEYIGFVDSDDYIDSKMFETMIGIAARSNADCVQCAFDVVGEDSEAVESRHDGEVSILEGRNAIVKSFFEGAIENSVWNKLYRCSNLSQIRFPEGWTFAEDFYFNAMSLLSCNRVALTDDVLYHYFLRDCSASHEKISDKHLKGFPVYDMVKKQLSNQETYRVVAEKEVSESLRFLDSSIGHEEISDDSIDSLIGRIKNGRRWIKGNRYLSVFGKIRARAVCLMPKLYVCFGGLFKKMR